MVTSPDGGQGVHSSRAHADRLIVLGFVITRVGVLVAGSAGMSAAYGVSTRPALYLAGVLTVCGWSLAMMVRALRLGRMPSPAWGCVDVAVSLAALALLGQHIHPQQITDPHAGLMWTAGLAGHVCAVVGLWARRPVQLLLSPLVVVVYLLLAVHEHQMHWTTTVTNAVLWLVFAGTTRFVATTWRDLASEADELRAQAARDAERQTLDRARLVVHDPAAILRMIADPATPDASLQALRVQAAAEAARLRTFMSDNVAPPVVDDEPATVASAVRAALPGFEDLPLDVLTDLAEDQPLDPATHAALTKAVATCLHNVREHAHATRVVVHADACEGRWEVLVRDDGRGFDPDLVTYGHGLRALVQGNLAAHGVATHVDSAPGQGCTVTLTSPA